MCVLKLFHKLQYICIYKGTVQGPNSFQQDLVFHRDMRMKDMDLLGPRMHPFLEDIGSMGLCLETGLCYNYHDLLENNSLGLDKDPDSLVKICL